MDDKDREIERLRTLAERAYPGLKPSGLCSRSHSDERPDYKCTICFPDWNALLMGHVKVNNELRNALMVAKNKCLSDIFETVTPDRQGDNCLVYCRDGCCGCLDVGVRQETVDFIVRNMPPTKTGTRLVFVITCYPDGMAEVSAAYSDPYKSPEAILSGVFLPLGKIKVPSLRPRWLMRLGFSAFGGKWRIIGDRCQ